MPGEMVDRSEAGAVEQLLAAAADQPSGLVLSGEAGIGKTTLWSGGIEDARERGFLVMSARVGEAESVLANTTVADLLSDVEPDVIDRLPRLQRLALDRVLLRDSGGGPETDHRVIAAGLLSVIEVVEADAPVLVAIDDVQWLDASSRAVLSFATRRMRGRVGALVTERSDSVDDGVATAWLQVGAVADVNRVRLGPLSVGALHAVITRRLGESTTRPTMSRIAGISGGNPFYALELARAMSGHSPDAEPTLPASLTELVRHRVGRLDGQAGEVLLAAACLANPTVNVLARATDKTPEAVVDLLDEPERSGVVVIEGNRVQFTHPLLARGVYTDAGPARRRQVHRLLADLMEQPELRARHLALATSSADEATLQALDVAAYTARKRGAPIDAAELLQLAIGLGGDNPMRRLYSAECYFRAGDTDHALKVLAPAIDQAPSGAVRAMALLVQATIYIHTDSFTPAVAVLKRAADDVGDDNPTIRVPVLMMLAFAQVNNGQYEEALHHARQARDAAGAASIPAMTSSALAIWVMVSFQCGLGFDVETIERACALEEENDPSPANFRASAIKGLLLGWTGELERAAAQMDVVAQRCLERSADTEMIFVSFHQTTISLWQARFDEAARHAADCYERCDQIGGAMRIVGLSVRGAVAVFDGREVQARNDLREAIDLAQRSAAPWLADLPVAVLGLLEVSLGNYADALEVYADRLSRSDAVPSTEICTTGHLADAIEAMVNVGRLSEAEPLIDAMERNGRALDRPWLLALGGRCRSMWLAAQGDVDGALRAVNQAMAEHDRLPMPFERCRTQLLLGQLQRRQRQKHAAAETLSEALHALEAMGTPLWAARARTELVRANVAPTPDLVLTPAEQRVAELAAAGLSNRDVAAKLFISPKTVEHNLSRVYRKLGIRSRAELGRRMDQLTGNETNP